MQRKIDKFEMYRTGCEFSDCADFCINLDNVQKYNAKVITPAIVNAAFACEVFLKLLLHIHNTSYKKNHKLKGLFELLPENLKIRIKFECLKKYGELKNCFGIEYLDNISDAFNKWRYNYEYDWSQSRVMKIETGFLFVFKDVLKEQFKDCYFYGVI